MSDPGSVPPVPLGGGTPTPPPPTAADGWVPDILPGFERLTLELEPDEEGEVVATLVRRAAARGTNIDEGGPHIGRDSVDGGSPTHADEGDVADSGVDVLYVHGWNDYFFQTHVADFWERQGVRFHALDLRRYGRSIRPHQTPGFIRDLSTYDEDIEAALVAMGHPAPAPDEPDGPATTLVTTQDAGATPAGSPLAGSLPSGGIAAAAVRALFKDPISELLSRGAASTGSTRLTEDPVVPGETVTPGIPATSGAPSTPGAASPASAQNPERWLPEDGAQPPGDGVAAGAEQQIDVETALAPPTPQHATLPELHRATHPGETSEDAAHMEPDPGRRKLLLVGHSTGGLTLSLWVSRWPGRADGLVLNSPWLEFQTRNIGRRLLEPGVRVHAALAPQDRMVNVDLGLYTRSISSRFDGEWDYDPTLRSDTGWRATPAWLSAILAGQEAVSRGLGITVPVLVLLSGSSSLPVVWSEQAMRTDTVLDVVGVARRCPDLGSHVTIVRVEGALHDVTLSAAPVREVVRTETERWFATYMGPHWITQCKA